MHIVGMILDLPMGLGCNSSKLADVFPGNGGVIDLGKKPLADVPAAPKAGYLTELKPKQILDGHTYCVRTADGKHYAKFHVVKFDTKARTLKIAWTYPIKLAK